MNLLLIKASEIWQLMYKTNRIEDMTKRMIHNILDTNVLKQHIQNFMFKSQERLKDLAQRLSQKGETVNLLRQILTSPVAILSEKCLESLQHIMVEKHQQVLQIIEHQDIIYTIQQFAQTHLSRMIQQRVEMGNQYLDDLAKEATGFI